MRYLIAICATVMIAIGGLCMVDGMMMSDQNVMQQISNRIYLLIGLATFCCGVLAMALASVESAQREATKKAEQQAKAGQPKK